ncbi:esterase [Pseudoalteromonas tunicata]|uniref:esterase n=1 Tax=Pseudoalteromonas tunicata TaxID=314281 RepID=UPI00273E1AA3|nr:esterase [Pseudoalteromonas tunicata]MDP5214128.1 esterase [Pseudoalteromonas tunicata]
MFKSRVLAMFFIVLLGVTTHAHAGQSETLTITSAQFKTPIEYIVTLPNDYHSENKQDKRYYLHLDIHPRSQGYISQLNDWLSHNGEWPWPQTIVVTPKNYHSGFAQQFEQLIHEPNNAVLLNYIEHDLLASIDKQYRTNGFRTYSGFMGNAAFGLHILLNRPQLFTGYILASPTLGDNMFNISQSAIEKLKVKDDKLRYLYISIGGHPYEQNSIDAVKKFEYALSQTAPSTLEWQVVYNRTNNYMSQPIIALINGIEGLFADKFTPLAADSAISQQGADAIIAYYQQLSAKKYGFEVSAEGSLKHLAESWITTEPNKAQALFSRIIVLYPESSYAQSSLAAFYASQGNLEQAIAAQQKAVEKAKNLVEWHQLKQQGQLEQYQLQLSEQKAKQ